MRDRRTPRPRRSGGAIVTALPRVHLPARETADGEPGCRRRIAQNAPSAVSPAVPLLVSQGLADTIVRPDITEAFVRAQCAAGAPVELDTYAGIGHFAVRTSAAPKVGAWLLDRLHGKPAPAGCATEQD